MSKFKVGDRVRVIVSGEDAEYWHSHEVGDIVEIEKVYVDGDYEASNQTMMPHWIEPAPTNTLTVGETYTSANGNKWECIFVRDGRAWLVGMYDGKAEGSAYCFDVDGTASWTAERDRAAYNIVFEPVRETGSRWVDIHGQTVCITFDLINGTPDWSTAKVTPCA